MRVRFDAIGEAWRLYMADMGQWILGTLLAGIITIVPILMIQFLVGMLFLPGVGMFGGGAGATSAQLRAAQMSGVVSALAALPVNVFAQLLYVGLQRRALLQARGYQVELTEIFRLGGMGVQVLIFNVLYVLIMLPLQLYYPLTNNPSQPFAVFNPLHLLSYCGIGIVLFAIQILLSFTPLIIVDQRLPVGPALSKCISTFGPQFLSLFGVMFVTTLLALCGAFACGIGALFTVPVFYVTYGVIYNDFFRPMLTEPVQSEFGAYPRPM